MSARTANTALRYRLSLLGSLRALLARALDTALLWQERARQRRALAGLEDHLLTDLGLSRADAAREADKPFWRA